MNKNKKLAIVTGGAGFIGSAIVKKLIKKYIVINIDCLTYASNLKNLENLKKKKNYIFLKIDISNFIAVRKLLSKYKPDYIINCAAETHVDRSISNSKKFIKSNIIGTYNLLETVRNIPEVKKNIKLFHQISTDEVYGDSFKLEKAPIENSSYIPSSPYSASKASADHLVVAWGRTYNIPFSISICTNNYGPRQYPEKLIPKTILNAINGKKIPIYGDGKQIRDWLFVEDHADAIEKIIESKKSIGNKFNISGNNQTTNIRLVNIICNYLNKKIKKKPKNILKFNQLIEFVKDRPGHDKKYFLNSRKIYRVINWKPKQKINKGLENTINWYLKNIKWWKKKS
tara:strand:- start:1273 stop:2298 length:1026 start_codon:yes stop_codon:yes gene_type:complete